MKYVFVIVKFEQLSKLETIQNKFLAIIFYNMNLLLINVNKC